MHADRLRRLLREPLLHLTGDTLHATPERHHDPTRVDHVWIYSDAGIGQRVMVSVNTLSIRNRDAGFDARIRMGRLIDTWDILPPRGIHPIRRFDYRNWEERSNIFYEHYDQAALEGLLLDYATRALILEAWGAPYYRHHLGLHQVHSRRASCAVKEDLIGVDGALRFYLPEDKTRIMLFFKFCGQP